MSWRDAIAIHPAANMLPRMPADELKALGTDIKANGLTSPIAVTRKLFKNGWEYMLLDGINRLDAMEAAGILFTLVLEDDKCKIKSEMDGITQDGETYPAAILVNEIDALAYVISANLHRRHLTTQQKLDLLDEVIKANPNISSRRAAKLIGASPTTAAKSRRKLEAQGDVSTVDTSIDTRGRKQPIRKPAPQKRRDVDDYLAEQKARLAAKAAAAPEPAPTESVEPMDCPTAPDTTDSGTAASIITLTDIAIFKEQAITLLSKLSVFGAWCRANPNNSSTVLLVRALKDVSRRMQTLAEGIEHRGPGDEAPAIHETEGQLQ